MINTNTTNYTRNNEQWYDTNSGELIDTRHLAQHSGGVLGSAAGPSPNDRELGFGSRQTQAGLSLVFDRGNPWVFLVIPLPLLPNTLPMVRGKGILWG